MMLFIQILLLISVFVCIAFGLIVEDEYGEIVFKLNKKMWLVIIPLALWVGTLCITFIPANNVGIKYSAVSGVSQNTLNEGLAFKSPLDTVYLIDTTVQERTVEKVSVQTKDAQWISMDVNVKYSVNKNNAFRVFKNYKTLENLQINLIANATQRSIEEITTQYNIMDVLGERRNVIYKDIEQKLKELLEVEGVDLKFITIKDTDAGKAIEKAIADEAVATKAVETAKQKQEQSKIEAETKLIKAEGEAKANAVKTRALTDEVLFEMWINKWDGKMPTVSGTDNAMIDISGLLGK